MSLTEELTHEDLTHERELILFLNLLLRKFDEREELDRSRRFTAGEFLGKLVVYDHYFSPAKPILGEMGMSQREAEDAANSLNSAFFVTHGMDVVNLNWHQLSHLGELPPQVGQAILLYVVSTVLLERP